MTPTQNIASDELLLMTIRSEGQFNTVVYEEHDRYRNQSSRDVILMNIDDIYRLELEVGVRVTVSSEAGEMRKLRVVQYNVARGCAAMYYPEANVLVPAHVDGKSGTPAFKNVRIRVRKDTVRN